MAQVVAAPVMVNVVVSVRTLVVVPMPVMPFVLQVVTTPVVMSAALAVMLQSVVMGRLMAVTL
jgi:hypothetical protein